MTRTTFLMQNNQANQWWFSCPEHWFPKFWNGGFLEQEYPAFGTFDGISVEEGIKSDKSGEILLKVWEHQKEFSRKLVGKYTAQVIYAFCYADPNAETLFWKEDNYPFTFFCRLQFKGNVDILRSNLHKLEEKLKKLVIFHI